MEVWRQRRDNRIMRKRILGPAPPRGDKPDGREWLNLRELAEVEVTSEADGYPVESAFSFGVGPGWRAATPGKQRIWLLFDRPQLVQRMRLRFDEANIARTQEFTVRSSLGAGEPSREVIRQQWNFSPDGSTVESEEYVVDLKGVTILELTIDPDRSQGDVIASLTDWRLG
jgi:hypothetical protein